MSNSCYTLTLFTIYDNDFYRSECAVISTEEDLSAAVEELQFSHTAVDIFLQFKGIPQNIDVIEALKDQKLIKFEVNQKVLNHCTAVYFNVANFKEYFDVEKGICNILKSHSLSLSYDFDGIYVSLWATYLVKQAEINLDLDMSNLDLSDSCSDTESN